MFNVLEHEMDNLTTWNTLATALVGVGSFLLSIAFTLWFENKLSPTATPAGEVLLEAGAPLAAFGSLFCYALAIFFLKKRGGTLRRIKQESDDGALVP